jgi:hypothetical protein
MSSVRFSSDERARQVLEVQAAWLRARASHDYGALDGIAADEFTAVQSDGRISPRERALTEYVTTVDADDLRVDDLDVRLYGNVAVVLGRASHPALTRPQRIVDVLVRRNQRWQLVTEVTT